MVLALFGSRKEKMNLTQRAIAGFTWAGISTVINTLVQFTQVAILARFLSPAEFGIVAVVQILVTFSTLFLDVGLSNAIIQQQDVTHRQLSSLYWFNISIGVTVF